MRDLVALNIYTMEEMESSKFARVKTADECVTLEAKIEELKQTSADLVRDKVAYNNDKLVQRLLIRLESAINFLTKACSGFTQVADAVLAQRADLDGRRKATLKKLEESKMERKAEVAAAQAKMAVADAQPAEEAAPVVVKRKAGRPKKK